MASSHRRGPWSQAEDAYLVELVHTQGALNWVRIAQLIGSRSPKQCRERYHQNLKPSLNHEPISPEEGLQIERLVGEMGKRWAEIARRLHGRSDNAVKNWWNGSMNRRRRLVLRRRPSAHAPPATHERAKPLSFRADCPLTISSMAPFSSCARVEPPLPSPSVSEVSRSDSCDGAPSLVSDNSSAFSTSPRAAAASPRLELPPLTSSGRVMDGRRRPSLTLAQSNSSVMFGMDQSPFRSPRFPTDHKAFGPAMLSPSLYSSSTVDERPCSSPHEYQSHDMRGHFPTAPPTPIQLPPLQECMARDRMGASFERDHRMHLTSLLG